MSRSRRPTLLRNGVLPAAFALLACGGIGRDDQPDPPSAPSLGRWEDLGVVEVCLGAARAVPGLEATPPAAGLCAAGDPLACRTDADCRGSEHCGCGRCRVTRCDAADVCPASEVCVVALGRCTRACDPADPTACGAGQACDLGGCVTVCEDDADCDHGEHCSARTGHCLVTRCTDDSGCAAGWRCEIQQVAAQVSAPDPACGPDAVPFVLAEVRQGGTTSIHRFDWPDPTHLSDPLASPILAPEASWEEDRVGAPDLVRDREGWRLFYAGGPGRGIGSAAVDDDGFGTVRISAEPLLAPTHAWELARLDHPTALNLEDGRWLLLYEGGAEAGIGAALSEDGLAFERLGTSPLLRPAALAVPDRWRDLDRLADPELLGGRADPILLMAARGVVPGGEAADSPPADWSLGAAVLSVGADGIIDVVVDPFGPALAARLGTAADQRRDERGPGVLALPGEFRLLYEEGAESGAPRRLRAAVSR